MESIFRRMPWEVPNLQFWDEESRRREEELTELYKRLPDVASVLDQTATGRFIEPDLLSLAGRLYLISNDSQLLIDTLLMTTGSMEQNEYLGSYWLSKVIKHVREKGIAIPHINHEKVITGVSVYQIHPDSIRRTAALNPGYHYPADVFCRVRLETKQVFPK